MKFFKTFSWSCEIEDKDQNIANTKKTTVAIPRKKSVFKCEFCICLHENSKQCYNGMGELRSSKLMSFRLISQNMINTVEYSPSLNSLNFYSHKRFVTSCQKQKTLKCKLW